MAEGKYGRLFTLDDVREIVSLVQWGETGDEVIAEAERLGMLTFPADEPLFLLRGQDEWAEEAIRTYERTADLAITVRMEPKRVAFRDAVRAALAAFQEFARNCPERVKAPD